MFAPVCMSGTLHWGSIFHFICNETGCLVACSVCLKVGAQPARQLRSAQKVTLERETIGKREKEEGRGGGGGVGDKEIQKNLP